MNKKVIFLIIISILVLTFLIVFLVFDNISKENVLKDAKSNQKQNEVNVEKEENKMNNIKIKVNNEILNIKLDDNSSSEALVEILKQGDLVIEAHDYGNFEKVGDLGFELPTNDTRITTKPGDLILYQGNQITLYYDTNTWSFTKLGEVVDKTQDELKKILGNGNVTLILSLN